MKRLVVAIVVVAVAATTLMLALQRGLLWPAAASGGVVSGLLLAVAWTLRPRAPRFTAVLTGGAVVPAALLALMSPGAGAAGIGVAVGVLVAWVYGLSRPRSASEGAASR